MNSSRQLSGIVIIHDHDDDYDDGGSGGGNGGGGGNGASGDGGGDEGKDSFDNDEVDQQGQQVHNETNGEDSEEDSEDHSSTYTPDHIDDPIPDPIVDPMGGSMRASDGITRRRSMSSIQQSSNIILPNISKRTPKKYSTPKAFAFIACLSVCSAFTSAILVTIACFHTGEKLAPQQGMIKLHYVFEMFAFLAFIHAVVAYRLYWIVFKWKKLIHVCSHITALGLMLTGVALRIYAKNRYKTTAYGQSKYEPHFFTLHSFIAIATVLTYLCQLFGSIYLFRISTKKNVITFHREIGIFIIAGFASGVSAGLQQVFSRLRCSAFGDGNDYSDPFKSYLNLPKECKLINIAGLLVYVSVFLATIAVSRSGLDDILRTLLKGRKKTSVAINQNNTVDILPVVNQNTTADNLPDAMNPADRA